MTHRDLIADSSRILREAGVETPFLDAVILLSHVSGYQKERIMASFPDPVPDNVVTSFRKAVAKRVEGQPISYICRAKEFYGREFYVDPRVLVPRPTTEALVETALNACRSDSTIQSIHDACTGSGCVAITLAAELPEVSVSASDSSLEVEPVFELNCNRILGRLLPFSPVPYMQGLHRKFDMVTANPPYLTDSEVDRMIEKGWPEPDLALRGGGNDGMDIPLRFISVSVDYLRQDGYLLIEGASGRMAPLAERMEENGFSSVQILPDLSGCERVVFGRLHRPGQVW